MKFCNPLRSLCVSSKPDSIFNRQYRYQLLACLSLNIITFSHGIATGWMSPTLTKFHSENSPIPFDVSNDEASWIGSMLGMGSFFGTLTTGCLLNLLGRKKCIYLTALPQICHWILIYSAPSAEYLYIARFCGGFTGGSSFVLLPIFISEISDNRIRGTLGSMLMLSINFGILIGYTLSPLLTYYLMPCLIVVLPIMYTIIMTRFPETPQHLLRQKKDELAERSFKFYKNCLNYADDEELQKSNVEFKELKLIITNKNNDNDLHIRDFCTKPALKAQCTAAVLILMNQGCGSFAFVTYMSSIFKESGAVLDPDTSTIIVGIAQIMGACCVTLLVDRAGRKLIYLSSNGGLIIGLTAFGFYTFYAKRMDLTQFNWIPVALMAFIVFMASMGVIALTFVLIVEILPNKIRSLASSFSMAGISAMVFLMLKIFPTLMANFGISVTMWIFAGVSCFCFIYLSFCLEETKGKSMDAE